MNILWLRNIVLPFYNKYSLWMVSSVRLWEMMQFIGHMSTFCFLSRRRQCGLISGLGCWTWNMATPSSSLGLTITSWSSSILLVVAGSTPWLRLYNSHLQLGFLIIMKLLISIYFLILHWHSEPHLCQSWFQLCQWNGLYWQNMGLWPRWWLWRYVWWSWLSNW